MAKKPLTDQPAKDQAEEIKTPLPVLVIIEWSLISQMNKPSDDDIAEFIEYRDSHIDITKNPFFIQAAIIMLFTHAEDGELIFKHHKHEITTIFNRDMAVVNRAFISIKKYFAKEVDEVILKIQPTIKE